MYAAAVPVALANPGVATALIGTALATRVAEAVAGAGETALTDDELRRSVTTGLVFEILAARSAPAIRVTPTAMTGNAVRIRVGLMGSSASSRKPSPGRAPSLLGRKARCCDFSPTETGRLPHGGIVRSTLNQRMRDSPFLSQLETEQPTRPVGCPCPDYCNVQPISSSRFGVRSRNTDGMRSSLMKGSIRRFGVADVSQ